MAVYLSSSLTNSNYLRALAIHRGCFPENSRQLSFRPSMDKPRFATASRLGCPRGELSDYGAEESGMGREIKDVYPAGGCTCVQDQCGILEQRTSGRPKRRRPEGRRLFFSTEPFPETYVSPCGGCDSAGNETLGR